MIWYFMSVASYLLTKVVRFLKTPQVTNNVTNHTGGTNKGVSFAEDSIFDDVDYSSPRSKKKLTRMKSFAAGIDGHGQSIAILTSGGDAQGMNSAYRATVRMALYAGAKAFAVYWGYQGLVDGGDNIKEVFWDDVHGIIHQGGTVIGSARCSDFRERTGRKKAAYNLVKNGITNLVVIGGDGSLTGADIFRTEWKSLLVELCEEGKITPEEIEDNSYLSLVGMVGSIDNDFCGTDMTIGADSALNRIVQSVDTITTTAESHQRAFILEVMGRHCGYLALIAGMSCNADWVFLPEWPLEDGWEDDMMDNLKRSRAKGRLSTIIILAEGAQDIHGNPVKADELKQLLSNRLKYDTRVTILGHVQRGGTPSAFDRLLASRFGAEAALCVLENQEGAEPSVMCLVGSQIVKKPLHQCVDQCNAIKAAYKERDFKKVVELRGIPFQNNLKLFKILKHVAPPKDSKKSGRVFAVINIGAPAGGMNAATGAFTRAVLYHGHTVLGITDGFDGLMQNKVSLLEWAQVDKWTGVGGSNLGVTRTLPEKHFQKISERFREHKIQALLIVGGFEGYHSLIQLTDARKKYSEFCIPMVIIPATMSNNVPGTWFSLGADTTLNVIVECCDRLRQSAGSSHNRVYIVETMGGKCGYLATMAAIAGGADAAYTYEEKFTLADLKKNCRHLIEKFKHHKLKKGLVLRTENCNENYTTDFISRLYSEEGKGVFTTRTNVLGYIQQGGSPSPFDRVCGTRQAVRAYNFLNSKIEENRDEFGLVNARGEDSSCVLGHIKNATRFTPVEELKPITDFKNRLPTEFWWSSNIRPLLRILAHYEVMYNRDVETDSV